MEPSFETFAEAPAGAQTPGTPGDPPGPPQGGVPPGLMDRDKIIVFFFFLGVGDPRPPNTKFAFFAKCTFFQKSLKTLRGHDFFSCFFTQKWGVRIVLFLSLFRLLGRVHSGHRRGTV